MSLTPPLVLHRTDEVSRTTKVPSRHSKVAPSGGVGAGTKTFARLTTGAISAAPTELVESAGRGGGATRCGAGPFCGVRCSGNRTRTPPFESHAVSGAFVAGYDPSLQRMVAPLGPAPTTVSAGFGGRGGGAEAAPCAAIGADPATARRSARDGTTGERVRDLIGVLMAEASYPRPLGTRADSGR